MNHYGPVEWIMQVQEGVARLVNQAVQQLSGGPGPGMNEMPFREGGGYSHPPITEQHVQAGYVDQNPAAQERHMQTPQNAQQANAAQQQFEQAQRNYAAALQQQGVQQQVQGLQGAAAGMDQFAQLAGVHDPTQPAPQQQPAAPAIILPPGVSREEPPDAGESPVPVLW